MFLATPNAVVLHLSAAADSKNMMLALILFWVVDVVASLSVATPWDSDDDVDATSDSNWNVGSLTSDS